MPPSEPLPPPPPPISAEAALNADASGAEATPADLPSQEDALERPEEPKKRAYKRTAGSFSYDLHGDKFTLQWASWDDFEVWFKAEQREKGFEFCIKDKPRPANELYSSMTYYYCARQGSGGQKNYTKKNPEGKRKIPTKRTGCNCSLTVKTYPGVTTVLGQYEAQHDHPIGGNELRFTRVSTETRTRIAEMLRMKIVPDEIVSPQSIHSNRLCLLTEFPVAASRHQWRRI